MRSRRPVTGVSRVRNPRPGNRALRARNPKRVRKESGRVSWNLRPRGAPESPKSAPRSPKRVQKRSFGLFLDSFRTPERTLWGLWGSPGPEALDTLFGLFFRARRAREPSVPGRWVPNSRALRARVSREVSPKTGVSDGVSDGVSLGPFSGTLLGHSGACAWSVSP